jgi:hypothetical protein
VLVILNSFQDPVPLPPIFRFNLWRS